ncbi:MAG: thioredoxin domain-containing protein [Desulfovermiculus sp.]|nr:thioredoxin domain-containing protein [Desulfovermiculus sp.]
MSSAKETTRSGREYYLGAGPGRKAQAGMQNTFWRWSWGVVFGLVIALTAMGLVGCGQDQPEKNTQESTHSEAQSTQNSKAKSDTSFKPDTVLATVNGKEITARELQEFLSSLSESQQQAYTKNKQDLLESMIIRTALLQEAKRLDVQPQDEEGAGEKPGVPAKELGEDDLISALFDQEVLNEMSVQEDDLRRFYEQNKEQMPADSTFEEIKEQLRPYVLQMEQQKAVRAYIDDLLQQVSISKNEDWIAAQKAKSAGNPLAKALETDRPVLADFGRGSCIPCKMMEPILEELQEEYKGRAEILVLDVGEYPVLTRRYSIRTIPTQIFFDASGEQVKRHEGFMSKEDIVGVLQELKVAAN